jgi:hypothetical protein
MNDKVQENRQILRQENFCQALIKEYISLRRKLFYPLAIKSPLHKPQERS